MAAGRQVLRGAVGAVLGREHLLQLAVVEEYPAAVLTLVDVHALPVDRPHPSMTFRTSHAGQDRLLTPSCFAVPGAGRGPVGSGYRPVTRGYRPGNGDL